LSCVLPALCLTKVKSLQTCHNCHHMHTFANFFITLQNLQLKKLSFLTLNSLLTVQDSVNVFRLFWDSKLKISMCSWESKCELPWWWFKSCNLFLLTIMWWTQCEA
jgi:hypothetical protein